MRIKASLCTAVALALAAALAAPAPALASDARLKLEVGDLTARAKEVVNIVVDRNTIGWAAQAVADKGGDAKELEQLMKELEGVYVHVLEFEKDKAPSWAEMQAATRGVIAKLDGPGWNPIISVTERKEEGAEVVRISIYTDAEGKPGGLAIFALEPTEIALINIVGPVQLDQLGRIGAALGKPGMFGPLTGDKGDKPKSKKAAKETKKQ